MPRIDQVISYQTRRIYHRARREMLQRVWPLYARRSLRFWAVLRSRHEGQTAFIVGNGPSLTSDDLDRLDGCLTLASNRIDLAFEQTVWRPSYFAMADWVLFPKVRDDVGRTHRRILAGPDLPRRIGTCRVVQYRWLGRTDREVDGAPLFSADAGVGLYSGGTITFDLMQIAAHLGATRIVLLGCDHDYVGENDVDPAGLASAPSQSNHFHPNYRSRGELVRPACIELMSRAFRHAAAWSVLSGVPIVNATRGGKLEIFDRVSLNDELDLAIHQQSSIGGCGTLRGGVGSSSDGVSMEPAVGASGSGTPLTT
jgi:hypothetical protein